MAENLSHIEDAEQSEASRERSHREKSRLSASEMVDSGSEFEKRKAAAAIEWYMTGTIRVFLLFCSLQPSTVSQITCSWREK